MPDHVGGADCPAGVTSRGLQIAFCETRSVFDLAVSDGIVGATAGERDRGVAIATLQGVQQIKKAVLVNRLGGKRQIAVTILDRRVRVARRTQRISERLRKQRCADGFTAVPLIRDIVFVVAKVLQIECKTAVVA
jgi:hypothetical protein